MLRRFALATLVVASIIGAACSIYTAESPAVPLADAATDSSTTVDGANGGDAGIDAADTRRFCEKQNPAPTFCRDFDDGAPLFFAFDHHDQEADGGTVALDTKETVSTPASFFIELPAGPLRSQSDFFLRRMANEMTFEKAASSVRLAFDLRVDDLDDTRGVRTGVICVPLSTGGGSYCTWLEMDASNAALVEQGPVDEAGIDTKFHTLGLPFIAGKWTRVELMLTVGTAPKLGITFDGYDAKPEGPVAPPTSPSVSMATIGLNAIVYGEANDSIPAIEVRYDNVVVDVK